MSTAMTEPRAEGLREAIERIVARLETGTHRDHDKCYLREIKAVLAATPPAEGLDVGRLAEVLHRLAYSDWNRVTDDPPVMDVGDLSNSGNETALGLAERIAREYAALAPEQPE